MNLRPYISISRPSHWFKNVFVIPGTILALALTPSVEWESLPIRFVLGMIAVCLAASANYVLNEWLDARFDRHHPEKKTRPAATGAVRQPWVTLEYLAFAGVALFIASRISTPFTLTTLLLLTMGLIYNVAPLRAKDQAYVDVLIEAINNPIRFVLGWLIVCSNPIPPSSILMAYWMGGCYLMTLKRFAETRSINDEEVAARYRRSLGKYSEEKLLSAAVFYAITCTSMMGVFLVKHRVEYVLSLPLIAVMFVWYLVISFRKDSVVQHPEKLYRETSFLSYTLFLCVVLIALLFVDIPQLEILLRPI